MKNITVICDKAVSNLIKAELIKKLDHESVRRLCLMSKTCWQNFYENKTLWRSLLYQKYGRSFNTSMSDIDVYYGQKLEQINKVGKRNTIYIGLIKDFKIFFNIVAILDIQSVLKIYDHTQEGLISKSISYNGKRINSISFVDDIKLASHRERYFMILRKSTLYVIDLENTLMTKVSANVISIQNDYIYHTINGTYMKNGKSIILRSDDSLLTMIHDKSIKLIIDGIDYSRFIKLIDFTGDIIYKSIILLDDGQLYEIETSGLELIDYINRGKLILRRIASDVTFCYIIGSQETLVLYTNAKKELYIQNFGQNDILLTYSLNYNIINVDYISGSNGTDIYILCSNGIVYLLNYITDKDYISPPKIELTHIRSFQLNMLNKVMITQN